MSKLPLYANLSLSVLAFILGCSQASDSYRQQSGHQEGTEVLANSTFVRGGSIAARQNGTLMLSPSSGWTWARLPRQVDINRNSRVTMRLKTTDACEVYFELKGTAGPYGNALIGHDSVGGVWKTRLDVPNTAGTYKDVVVDLADHYRPEVNDRRAEVMVFSDPACEIEIQSIRFQERP